MVEAALCKIAVARIAVFTAAATGIHGVLEIKGKRQDLDVPFSLHRAGSRLSVSGTLTLNRLTYGIGTGEWSNTQWLGGEVSVEFRAALFAK